MIVALKCWKSHPHGHSTFGVWNQFARKRAFVTSALLKKTVSALKSLAAVGVARVPGVHGCACVGPIVGPQHIGWVLCPIRRAMAVIACETHQ